MWKKLKQTSNFQPRAAIETRTSDNIHLHILPRYKMFKNTYVVGGG
jgi:hypothetical protein